MAKKQWRCFFCDEVFSTQHEAAEHFGVFDSCEADIVACQIKGHEKHLVRYIRKLEREIRRYQSEDSDVMRSIMALEDDSRRAVIRAEEEGYNKGVRDGRAMPAPKKQHPNYEEGEAPWSEDEQFEEQRKACEARRKEYGQRHCGSKDGSCTECEEDACGVLCAKYPVPETSSPLSRPHGK